MGKSDKTEKPTAKRKQESRKKGQIAKSQDLTAWTSLLIGIYLLPMTIGKLAEVVNSSFNEIRASSKEIDNDAIVHVLATTLRDGFLAIIPLLAAVVTASVVVTMGQTGLFLALKPLVPDFKRINPKQGFQRLVSPRSLWETVKQLLKIAVVMVIAWPRVLALVNDLAGHGRLPLGSGLMAAGDNIMGLIQSIAWTMVVLSFADYGYQRYQNAKDQRMTKQEVKDEHRNAEGDAMVKGRMRSMQRSVARNRMIAGISDADVIVTNPTHVAVALKYDPDRSRAPIVVAVGAGAVAERIRDRAREDAIPMVEAKPLARALWRACQTGDEIPTVLFEAVAQVLAFVKRLDRRLVAGRQLELPRNARVPEELLSAVPRKRNRR